MAHFEIPVGSQELTSPEAIQQYSSIGYYTKTNESNGCELILSTSPGLYAFGLPNSMFSEYRAIFDETIYYIGGVLFICSSSPIEYTIYSNHTGYTEPRHRVTQLHTLSNGKQYYCNRTSYSLASDNGVTYLYYGIYNAMASGSILQEVESIPVLPYGVTYPITYHYTNSTVTGPSEAAVGETVAVSAVSDVGYGITDASTQILVTNNDVAVPYTWDATNQRITFTMPDPS